MSKPHILRELKQYPLDDDGFDWKWFGTLAFPEPTPLRRAERILRVWRNDLEKFEGQKSLNIMLVMECHRQGIRFHVVVGGQKIESAKPWMRRWQELGGVGTLYDYDGNGAVMDYFASKFGADSAFDCQDCFGGDGWYIPDYLLQGMFIRGCCIGAQPKCQLWSRKC